MITRHQNTNTNLTPNTVHRIFIRYLYISVPSSSFFFFLFFFLHTYVTFSHHLPAPTVSLTAVSLQPPPSKLSPTTAFSFFSDQLRSDHHQQVCPSFRFCKRPATLRFRSPTDKHRNIFCFPLQIRSIQICLHLLQIQPLLLSPPKSKDERERRVREEGNGHGVRKERENDKIATSFSVENPILSLYFN